MSQQHNISNLILTLNLMNHQLKFINKSKTSKAKLISIIHVHIHNKILE